MLQDTDSGYSVQPDLAACQALCGNTQVDPLLEKTWSDPDDEYVMSHRVCYDSDRNEVHLALVTNHDADSASLTGTEEAMRAFCLTIPGCTAIHDAHRDGTNWRACCSVTAHAQLSADNYDCAPGSGVTGVLTGATHRSTDGNFEGCAALCDAAGSQTCGGFDYEPLTSGSHACRLYSWGGKIDWLTDPNTGQYHTRQYCVGRGRATVRTRVAVPPTACSAIIWGTPDAGSPNGADSYANHCYLYADPLPFDPVGQGCVLDDGFGYDTYAISMAQAPQSCLASYNNDAAFSPLCCDQTEWSVTRVDLNCHRSHTGVPNLLHASSNEFEVAVGVRGGVPGLTRVQRARPRQTTNSRQTVLPAHIPPRDVYRKRLRCQLGLRHGRAVRYFSDDRRPQLQQILARRPRHLPCERL